MQIISQTNIILDKNTARMYIHTYINTYTYTFTIPPLVFHPPTHHHGSIGGSVGHAKGVERGE